MNRSVFALALLACAGPLAAQSFDITGTLIPPKLLAENYGTMPKNISGYDLSICNVSDTRQSIVSSRIYQALSQANNGLQPIGREVMLAAILRNQSHSAATIANVVLNSVTGVLAVLGTSKYKLPTGLGTATALTSLAGQQLLTNLKPVLTADQVEKFEGQVLEPALVLDSGSCVERTVFASVPAQQTKAQALDFHVR